MRPRVSNVGTISLKPFTAVELRTVSEPFLCKYASDISESVKSRSVTLVTRHCTLDVLQ